MPHSQERIVTYDEMEPQHVGLDGDMYCDSRGGAKDRIKCIEGYFNYLHSVVKTKIPYTLVVPEYYSSVFYIAGPTL
jgi:hypothetical protein